MNMNEIKGFINKAFNYLNEGINPNIKAGLCVLDKDEKDNDFEAYLDFDTIVIKVPEVFIEEYFGEARVEIVHIILHELSHLEQCMIDLSSGFIMDQSETELANENNTIVYLNQHFDEIVKGLNCTDIYDKLHYIIDDHINKYKNYNMMPEYIKANTASILWYWLLSLTYDEEICINIYDKNPYELFKQIWQDDTSSLSIIVNMANNKDLITFSAKKDTARCKPKAFLNWEYKNFALESSPDIEYGASKFVCLDYDLNSWYFITELICE